MTSQHNARRRQLPAALILQDFGSHLWQLKAKATPVGYFSEGPIRLSRWRKKPADRHRRGQPGQQKMLVLRARR
jgi:hypothetical protein